MRLFLKYVGVLIRKLKSLFVQEKNGSMTKNKTEATSEVVEEKINQNIRSAISGFKTAGLGYKRLFAALYVLGIGAVLFWLLGKYGLIETFVTYLAAFTVFYWLLVFLFVWVKEGFEKK